MEQRTRECLNALIIGICIVVSCGFLSFGLSHFRSDSTHVISATGSSSVDFESDIIIWRGSFSSVADTSQEAYSKIKKELTSWHSPTLRPFISLSLTLNKLHLWAFTAQLHQFDFYPVRVMRPALPV